MDNTYARKADVDTIAAQIADFQLRLNENANSSRYKHKGKDYPRPRDEP